VKFEIKYFLKISSCLSAEIDVVERFKTSVISNLYID